MFTRRFTTPGLALALTLAPFAAARAQASYTIRSLPTQASYPAGRALGINNAGQVVGKLVNSAWLEKPARWDNGVLTVLPGGPNGVANDINDSGVAAGLIGQLNFTSGAWWAPTPGSTLHIDLSTAPPHQFSAANGINANGGACGESRDSFLWQPAAWLTPAHLGNPVMLPLLAGHISGRAYALNSSNLIVGECDYQNSSVPVM